MTMGTRIAIQIGDRLFRGPREFRFERRLSGERLQFEAVLDGERITMSDNDVVIGVAAGRHRIVPQSDVGNRLAEATVGVDFSTLPEPRQAEGNRRRAYLIGLREMGIRKLTRNKVEPAVRLLAERFGDDRVPGFASICRWAKNAGENIDVRRLVGRHQNKGGNRRFSKEITDIISELVKTRYLAREQISVTELHNLVLGKIQSENEFRPPNEKLAYPSRWSLYKFIAKLNRRDVEEARHGKRSAAHKYDPVRQRADPEYPLDLVEMDHTLLDLFVVDDEHMLPIGRPYLTLAIDRCTRIPLGWYIGFEPPSVHSVMQCLRFAILPKPDFNAIFPKDVFSTWSDQLAGLVDGPRIENDFPCHGFPRELSLDRGMEFIGTDLADFAGSLGISLRNAPRKSPEYKGAIERFFGTINVKLLHNLKGTTFSNIFERGEDYDPVKNAVVPFTMLQWLTSKFFIDIYSVDKHDGLNGIPKQVWLQKTEDCPVRCVHDIAELDMLMGRVD